MFFLTHKSSCMQNGMNNAGTELPEWIIFHWKPGVDGLPYRNGLRHHRDHGVCVSVFLLLDFSVLIHMKVVLCQWSISSLNALNDNNNQSSVQFSSFQSLSRVRLFATPWITAHQASLSITNSWSSLKLMSIESVMPSSHLILCHPLLLLPPIPPSIRVFSNESALHIRWPKYWSFSFGISPSSEHPGLISFRMDWLDLLAVQGTLKSLLQHHSSKASILWCSTFFTVQLSHPYMTTGKTIALTQTQANCRFSIGFVWEKYVYTQSKTALRHLIFVFYSSWWRFKGQ